MSKDNKVTEVRKLETKGKRKMMKEQNNLKRSKSDGDEGIYLEKR